MFRNQLLLQHWLKVKVVTENVVVRETLLILTSSFTTMARKQVKTNKKGPGLDFTTKVIYYILPISELGGVHSITHQ